MNLFSFTESPPLPQIMLFAFKSVLYDFSRAILVFCVYIFKMCLLYIIVFCFSSGLSVCFLIRLFSLFIFNIIINTFECKYTMLLGSPGGSMVKNPPTSARDTVWSPDRGDPPGGGNGNPLQYSCLENPMEQSSLVGCSPRGCKESDRTEQLSRHVCIPCFYFLLVLPQQLLLFLHSS